MAPLLLRLLVGLLAGAAARAASIAEIWKGTYWGEPGSALLAYFGGGATGY